MENNSTTTSYRLYENDREYKIFSNFLNYINQAQDFYNGKQYPESTKNMIRVVLNICDYMVKTKSAKICGAPIYLAYTADTDKVDCTALRQFDEYNCNKLGLKEENHQSALNGYTNGTEITFLRWDDDDTSYKGIYKGGLKIEHIDIRNFAVANPYIQDIQNQKWVMFWKEESLGALKQILEVRKGEDKQKKIEALERDARKSWDDSKIDAQNINHALVRVFTRFFRIDGEVYFTCETESVELFAYPHPLSRRTAKNKAIKLVDEYLKNKENDNYISEDGEKILDFNIDYEDMIMNTKKEDLISDEEYKNIKEKFSLYPFAVFEPIKENGSFYGRSDVKVLIPIQKGINFMISMLLKCSENNAYNKIFAKPDALQGQEITNEPSQVVIDYSQFTNGWGIKMAESQPMPNGLLDFVQSLFNLTRTVYGFSDVMDGSITNQDMSGYMLQQMIKQSNTTIEQQMMLFWQYNVRMAEIRLMFYKHYVDKAKYTFEYTDAEYENEEQARKILYNRLLKGEKLETRPDLKAEDLSKETNRTQIGSINGEDLYGSDIDISIDAMQGLSDSKLVEQQFFDNLLLNGGINNISPDVLDVFLQVSPSISPRTKTSLKKAIETIKQGTISKQQQMITELTEKLKEAAQYMQALDGKNKYLNEYLKNLQSEFTGKINNANKIIDSLYRDLQGKSEGEVKSENARGIAQPQALPQ